MAKKTKQEITETSQPMQIGQDNSQYPIITSVGWTKLPEGNEWVVVTMKTQGDKVLSVEHEVPNLKEIAVDTLKINVVKKLILADVND